MQEVQGSGLWKRYLTSCCPCSCGFTEYLGQDEQLLLETITGKEIINGPRAYLPSPQTVLRYEIRKATSLTAQQYINVKDVVSGEIKVVRGPDMYFLGPYEESGPVMSARVLSSVQGIYVSDKRTGDIRLMKGPMNFFPGPFDTITNTINAVALHKGQFLKLEDRLNGRVWIEKGEQLLLLEPTWTQIGAVRDAYSLKSNQYVRLQDSLTGKIRVERGEKLVFPGPFEDTGAKILQAYSLKSNQYVRLQDSLTGKIRVERGEKLVFPGPFENVNATVYQAIDLKSYEYCKIQDESTGKIRVERGEKMVWLGPWDKIVLAKKSGTTVDANNAALIKNMDTGLQTLITEPGLFIPEANEQVLSVRKVIRLADHQAVILKDKNGDFHYYYGDPTKGTARSFFIPPYWEQVRLLWSRGRRREKRDLVIYTFDTRPNYMSFEFNCRTSDNVEMILEGTFFWEVFSLPDMMRSTGDASGDVCAHARSCFIQLISKVKLAEFMDTFNAIAYKAHSSDDEFYRKRGIKIHSLEVTQYRCADPKTSTTLQQIIMETTNRMNRLSRQESENEVALAKIHASVVQEKARSEVLKIKKENEISTARADGEAEAEKTVAFLKHVENTMESKEMAQEAWHALRKQEGLKAVASGRAQVYFTPQDANITIENTSRRQ